MSTDTDLTDRIDAAARDVEDDVIEWRHHIHSHPELSNREEGTASFIVDRLRDFGYDDVTTDIAGHGVAAVLHGGAEPDDGHRRTVLLRADIDALPVREETDEDFASDVVDEDYPGGPFPVAHACGHDCHTAMLFGAAKVLREVADDLQGDVVLVFQPAEEGPPVDEDGGARPMLAALEDDVLADLDAAPTMAFGMHVAPGPSGWICYARDVQNASSELVKITVTGEQVHGSQPWSGRDPMPPAAEILTAMGQVYRRIDAQDAVTVSIGHIEDEGRFNIVGESVTMWGTVRCLADGVMDRVNEIIEQTVTHIPEAYGCSGEVEFLQQVPPVVNDGGWIDAVLPTLERVAGEDGHVVEVPASMGYDDVSEFINAYGGVYALLGVQDVTVDEDGEPVPEDGGRGLVPNHSPRFYANDDALVTGVRMHAHVALDHLRGALEPEDD
ncbi:M20 metallopeptidase family protein [Corynebacterium bovis]|uniref:Amidohydrolase n=1 Tax=Corynebacterium bovis DSM 20582 = CIP 54.80 TaxID=927655 RepID=A0A8I0CMS4_9CORY|nr:amidohydrolase [Corynebacterium bovis]MBB3116039.1 amidohydrolase [Corynebacterium bovis DSM 20582 = CIP 54.80]QQC46979.1 amidohydrolase [Corynebacterium bovis]WJY76625.1 N-acyl-L-amino acid amidohydrolase [Corynebacterium bovis DSM 20582 = CIP 54.80]